MTPGTRTAKLDTSPYVPKSGSVDGSLTRGILRLRSLQNTDGHWCAELQGDTILESEYALLRHFMGNLDDTRLQKLARYVRSQQREEGGWSLYPGGPSDVSQSVKAYLVLKMAGLKPDHPEMAKARQAILADGGVTQVNSFTKIYLAIFGLYDWEAAPVVPPELSILPRWFYLNLAEMSSWSRTIVVPLAIVSHFRPCKPPPGGVHIDELFVGERHGKQLRLSYDRPRLSWRNSFLAVDQALHFFERIKLRPWRRKALKRCEEWMVARFADSDGLGGIFPPMVNALLAMRCLGYEDDSPEVRSQWEALEGLEIYEGDTLRLQPCKSPIWDTVLAMNALSAAGLAADDPSLVAAGEWLVKRQVLRHGDWSEKRAHLEPGGWVFEYANDCYPDVDDTIAALMALRSVRLPDQQAQQEAIQRGLAWVLGMQGKDGGWASFDVDNDHMLFAEVPFADHNAMLDPSTSDITGRTLEMLGSYGFDTRDVRVQKALRFIRRDQCRDGSWIGRWGVNYIYGTWQVLKGLSSVGEDMHQAYLQQAADWLQGVQNEDGGWGESCDSYDAPTLKGVGPSTPSQTAWAVMGLMAAGRSDTPTIRSGIDWLTAQQREDGGWDEEWFTGTGFPLVFYLKYHLYATYFPVWALGIHKQLHSPHETEAREEAIR